MGLIKPFRRLGWQKLPGEVARAFDSLQAAIEEALAPLRLIPLLDGVLLEDLAVLTTATDFAHRLGRPWRGYLIVRADGSVNVWSAASPDESKFIRLGASASATVSVWVF